MKQIFALVDCNNFFASCEKTFHPEWQNRPLAVLSNNDGCVVSRSPEAKALGIPMGVPLFQIRHLVNSAKIVVCSSNYHLYGNMSYRVMQTLRQFAPAVEQYSVDEAFLELTELFRVRSFSSGSDLASGLLDRHLNDELSCNELQDNVSANNKFNCESSKESAGKSIQGSIAKSNRILSEEQEGKINNELNSVIDNETNSEIDSERLDIFCRNLVRTVPKWTGIPIAIGVGPTKTLAKIASRIAKKRNDFYCSLMFESEQNACLEGFDVGDVWGIGRRLLPKLLRLGIKTAAQLKRLDPVWMRKNFSIVQEKTVRELRGEACFALENEPQPRQSIQVARSFGEPLGMFSDIAEMVSVFTAKACEKARLQKTVAGGITLWLSTSRFRTDIPQYHPAETAGFLLPTNNTFEILPTVMNMLKKIFRPNFEYKKAGVLLFNLVDAKAAAAQGWLFNPNPEKTEQQRQKELALLQTIDRINRTSGKSTIHFASEGTERKGSPQSNYVSPCFTTRWSDLPIAR